MIKTILVPIDIAQKEAGLGALSLARDLAKLRGSKLMLLNVLEEAPRYVASQIPAGFHEKALADAAAKLKEIAARHDLTEMAEVVVRDGHPSTEILAFATEIGADMIVMDSHDPGLADYFLGSVAARVVRHAHCSVLVTRNVDS